jgi:hypothetical protein
MLVVCLKYCPEDTGMYFSKTSVNIYQTTWHHILDDSTLHSHHHETSNPTEVEGVFEKGAEDHIWI